MARLMGPLPDDQQHSRDGADQMLTRITRRKRDHAAAERWYARQVGRDI